MNLLKQSRLGSTESCKLMEACIPGKAVLDFMTPLVKLFVVGNRILPVFPHPRAIVVAYISSRQVDVNRTAKIITNNMQLGVLAALFQTDLPSVFSHPQRHTAGCPMRLAKNGIHHHSDVFSLPLPFLLRRLPPTLVRLVALHNFLAHRRHPFQHLLEDAPVAPALKAVVERFRRAILLAHRTSGSPSSTRR